VDLIKTKRLWIGPPGGPGLCFFLLAAALHMPDWLRWTAAVFWLMAIVSATHDIAADGFYMLGSVSATRPPLPAFGPPSTASA